MASVEIPEGLWAWALHKGRSQAIKRHPNEVVIAALVAARRADMTGSGLGTALQYLDMYAKAHGGRIDVAGLATATGHMQNAVLPLLPEAEAMGFIAADSMAPGSYRWLGYDT